MGAVLAVMVLLTGCGSGDERPAPVRPKLPLDVAQRLAAQSDKVAAAWAEGDACRAQDEAVRLQEEAIAAINERRVPAPFQEHLGAAVNDLAGRIVCVRGDEDDGKGNGKGKGKGKDKGKHEGDD